MSTPETVQASNKTILEVLSRVFRIKSSEIAAQTGVSRSFVSRLHHDSSFKPSDHFWANLNNALPKLINPTATQVFQLSSREITEEDLQKIA